MSRNITSANVDRYVKSAIYASFTFAASIVSACVFIVLALFASESTFTPLFYGVLGSILASLLSGLTFYSMQDKVWELGYTKVPLRSGVVLSEGSGA